MTKQCLALACLIICDNDDFDHRYDHDGDPDDNYSDHDNDDGDHDALYKGQFRCGYDEETRTKKIGQRAIEMRGGRGGGDAEETFSGTIPSSSTYS